MDLVVYAVPLFVLAKAARALAIELPIVFGIIFAASKLGIRLLLMSHDHIKEGIGWANETANASRLARDLLQGVDDALPPYIDPSAHVPVRINPPIVQRHDRDSK